MSYRRLNFLLFFLYLWVFSFRLNRSLRSCDDSDLKVDIEEEGQTSRFVAYQNGNCGWEEGRGRNKNLQDFWSDLKVPLKLKGANT